MTLRILEDVLQSVLSRRWKSPAAALVLLLGLSGCTVGPDYVRPEVDLNEEWKRREDSGAENQAPPDSAWWRAFNDATLDSLISMAYRQNLPLQIAGLRIMESRAQLAIAIGRKWPQVQVAFAEATGVGLSKYSANATGIDRNFWDYQVGFDAVWELDVWGKFRRHEQAATAEYFASIADYDDVLISLVAEVARTYAAIRTFEVLLEQARLNAEVQQEGLRIADARFRNGATSELDVSQATTLLESTRSTIPQLESSLEQAINALSTLLGQPTGELDAVLGAARGIPAGPPDVAVSVPAELLRRRPDVRSAELNAAAQSARIGVAAADLYPSFSLAGTIGTQTTTSGGILSNGASLSNLFGAGSWFYAFGPRMVWSIFNYGRIRNSVRVEDARFQQTLTAYQNTVLVAAQEVEDGIVSYLKAREATVFAENAARAALRSVELANVQYREGAVDYQRVLDAQRSLLEEENALAETRSSAATSLIALYKALGGGWEMRVGQPVIPDSTRIQMENRTNWGDMLSESPPAATSNEDSNQ